MRRSLLEEAGYRVETAINGEEGLKLFENAAFDLIVTDYRMPGMDGGEFIRRIRQVKPDARIVLLSGFVEHLGLTEQSTGADVVVGKTAREPAHLLSSVKRLLSRPQRKPPSRQGPPGAPGASRNRKPAAGE